MNSIRNWLAGMIVWMFALYNIERISEPINLATFVYVFAFLAALAILFVEPLRQIPLLGLFLALLPPFFFLKWYFGYEILGSSIPYTVTEICAIGITVLITGNIGRHLLDLREAISSIAINRMGKGSVPFDVGQSQIYREIRRARAHHKNASLLAIKINEQSMRHSVHRFIEEVQREIVKHYVKARVSNLLLDELNSTDIVAQSNNHFVVLLPETDKDQSQKVVQRIKGVACEKLDLVLEIGVSTFPDEALTFERLVEIAEQQMHESNGMTEEVLIPADLQKPVNT